VHYVSLACGWTALALLLETVHFSLYFGLLYCKYPFLLESRTVIFTGVTNSMILSALLLKRLGSEFC
jgi:hypothetical protein